MNYLTMIGSELRQARKLRFPKETMRAFAVRIGICRATLQKMEKGDLSVSLKSYYVAARMLGTTRHFKRLFEIDEAVLDG